MHAFAESLHPSWVSILLLTLFILPCLVQRQLSLTEKTREMGGKEFCFLHIIHQHTLLTWSNQPLPSCSSKIKAFHYLPFTFFNSKASEYSGLCSFCSLLLALAFLSHNLWQQASLSTFFTRALSKCEFLRRECCHVSSRCLLLSSSIWTTCVIARIDYNSDSSVIPLNPSFRRIIIIFSQIHWNLLSLRVEYLS